MEEGTFKSRMDGTIKNRKDYKNSLEDPLLFEAVSNIFSISNEIEEQKTAYDAFVGLCSIWTYDKVFLKQVADYFKSFDESMVFLNEYDSVKDLDMAWETYCELRDVNDFCPFTIK